MSVVYSTFAGKVVHENRGGTERFYGRDTLGSTAALYDSTGTKTDDYKYWPYGEVASHTGSSTTPLTFVGTLGYFIDAATRYYVRARVLMADLARWLTVDPLWPEQSAYGYVGGAPILGVDPEGTGDPIMSACQGLLCSNLDALLKAIDVIGLGGIPEGLKALARWLLKNAGTSKVQEWFKCDVQDCIKDSQSPHPHGMGVLINFLCEKVSAGKNQSFCYSVHCKGKEGGSRDLGACVSCCKIFKYTAVRGKCEQTCNLSC